MTFVEPPPPPDEGEFTPKTLGRILATLGRDQVDGMLELKGEGQVKHVYLVQGKPVFVKSTIPEESLGRMLLADKVISHEHYQAAAVEMAETGKRFGTVVAAMGLVSAEDLYYHLVKQTRLKIARCFAWPRGTFRVARENRYPADATTFESDAFAVVLDGYRHHIDAGPLEEAYEQHREHYLFLGEQPEVAAAREYLLPGERDLLKHADGKRRLGDVVADSELGLLAALRVTNGLISLGAVRLAQVESRPDLEGYVSEPPPAVEPPETDPRDQDRARRLKALFVGMEDIDYYELLGVERQADTEALQAAFRQRQKEFHPDTFTLSAPQRLHKMAVTVSRRLHQAVETLTNPERRSAYDARLQVQEPDRASTDQAASEAEGGPVRNRAQQAAFDFQQGLAAFEQRQYPTAVEAFRRAVDAQPKNIDYCTKLATAMFKVLDDPIIQWADVEAAAKQALALEPKLSEMLRLVGQVKARTDDDETALRYLNKALELDPKNQELKREVHYTEQRLKKNDKSWSLFGKKS